MNALVIALTFLMLIAPAAFAQYKWGSPVYYGKSKKTMVKSKYQSGFVKLQSGETLEGEISLKQVNGAIVEVRLKGGKKKPLEFPVESLPDYGLLLMIDDLTQDGTKTFKDNKRNFFKGYIVDMDGSPTNGLVAMQTDNTNEISHVMFAESPDAYVRFFSRSELTLAAQFVNGTEVQYQPYGEGFARRAPELELAAREFKNDTKELHPGYIVLDAGTRIVGKVAQDRSGSFAFGVSFVGVDGKSTMYRGELQEFGQTIDGANRRFINYRGAYPEVLVDGEPYTLFRSPPHPTTEDKFLPGLSRVGAEVATQAVTQQVAVYAADRAVKDEMSDSGDPIAATAAGAEAAADVVAGDRSAQVRTILKKEYIVRNDETGADTLVIKGQVEENMKPLLMGCGKYVLLDTQE